MLVFAYTAIDRQGRQTSGTLPAESRAGAMDQVLRQGMSPVSIEEVKSGVALKAPSPNAIRVSQAALESFTRELANLLAAGLPLSRALSILQREVSQPGAKKVWASVHDEVIGGSSLADSLAKWPRTFSEVYVAMVRAGEAGGFLHVVLQQIAEFRAREQDLKGKVKAAMIYPIILGLLACAVLIFLMTFFIPRFSGIFAEFGSQLPMLTQVIVAVSHTLMSYGIYLAVVLVGLVVLARRAVASKDGKRLVERAILKTPGFGRVVARFALVRFCRMLGTLVSSGVPLVNALRVAKEALGNQTLSDAVVHAVDEVERGASLARSLSANPLLFPPSVVEMVAVAEETGRLDKELIRLSIAYEADLDRQLRMLVAVAEPALLFVMASVIGTVVVGMLLPVFTLQDLIH